MVGIEISLFLYAKLVRQGFSTLADDGVSQSLVFPAWLLLSVQLRTLLRATSLLLTTRIW